MQEDPFYTLSIQDAFQRLETSDQGLSSSEVRKRLNEFGKNVLEEEKISKLKILFRQINSPLIYVLLVASIISISIGEITDFFVIIFIIAINTLIGFWQELKAETSIEALKKMTESKHNVVRDGKTISVLSSELVPGDYLIFYEGEVVTADVRLVESSGLMVDESSMTGESVPVIKDHTAQLPANTLLHDLKNMLLSGTNIVRGTGKGIVVTTGNQTFLAKIAEKGQEASPETPLTRSIKFFATKYVILLGALFVILGIVGYFQGRSIIDLSYILLACLVSAVPEGLPIVITLVMVIGVMALSKKKSLVRQLPAVESLGSATIIASDKTGTITKGELIVKEVHSQDLEKLKMIAALCNDSHEGRGDPLDVALAKWVEKTDEIRKNHPRKWDHPFDVKLKLMATVNAIGDKEELLLKGAYESLKEKVENTEELQEIENAFQSFLKQGLRVLAFGAGKSENHDPSTWKIKIVGLIGFLDPPKEGVKEAVDFSKKAGIKVIMITGDHPETGKAIAEEVGIWQENDRVITGTELEQLSDDQFIESIQGATVFARIIPEHKYRLVKLLQKSNEIVAVTGDGVNDVPALKAADIGIAMGSGTEAAKNASKMVITDNNLNVIVHAIENARVIADNIRKVIYYLISTSLQEITLIALAILSSLPMPLTAIQILWVNIVSDGVQDKTFAFAKAEGNVMQRKPRKPEQQFFDVKQVIRISYFGLSMGLIGFVLYLYLLDHYSQKIVSSILFTSIVVIQWANGIQAQKETEPFFKNLKKSITINPYIFVGVTLGLLLQSFAIYVVPELFHTTPMTLEHWTYPIFAFFAAFFIVEIRKWVEAFLYTRQARA